MLNNPPPPLVGEGSDNMRHVVQHRRKKAWGLPDAPEQDRDGPEREVELEPTNMIGGGLTRVSLPSHWAYNFGRPPAGPPCSLPPSPPLSRLHLCSRSAPCSLFCFVLSLLSRALLCFVLSLGSSY